MGDTFFRYCRGWNVGVFTGNLDAAKEIDLPIIESVPFSNGTIDCRLLLFDLN
jgi:putative N6-adenine-specific DNA methylase